MLSLLISVTLLHQVNAGVEDIDLNYTASIESYDELFTDGVRAYNEERWMHAIDYLQKALADFRHEREVKAQCWLKCQSMLNEAHVIENSLFDGHLKFLRFAIKMKRCAGNCERKFLGRRGPVSRQVQQSFEDRIPYNYLQFAFYKVGQLTHAAQAAMAFYEVNLSDTDMDANIDFYAKELGVNRSSILSYEEMKHVAPYKKGLLAHENEDYPSCVHHFEDSLTACYKEMDICYALCESQHESRQSSISVALFSHYVAILECRMVCRQKITFFNGQLTPSLLPFYYHYLQYCYYKVGNVMEATSSALTYALFNPSDVAMKKTIGFYRNALGGRNIEPRIRGQIYVSQFIEETQLLSVAKGYADPKFPSKLKAETEQDDNFIDEDLDIGFRAVRVVDELGDRPDQKDGTISKAMEYRDQNRWRRHPAVNDSVLYMNENQLNGTERVAFDGVASDEQCGTLMRLAQKLASVGDGYDHSRKDAEHSREDAEHSRKDAEHPFTEKEVFSGVTVAAAVNAVASGRASLEEVELYLNMSEKVRLLVQEYFDMPVTLHFAFTHLVCRHAVESEVSVDEHLSHPIHSDNCVLDGDGLGTCPKRSPAYTWRDYSGLLYLNGAEDFEGGEFVFADRWKKIRARLQPKCGRAVAFRSQGTENLHGVLGVRKGYRCALPLWFTFDESKSEVARTDAVQALRAIRESRAHQPVDKPGGPEAMDGPGKSYSSSKDEF